MAYSGTYNYFPSQVVSDIEKLSYDYGLKVAKAIQHEWFEFDQNRSNNRYRDHQANFHRLRLYA